MLNITSIKNVIGIIGGVGPYAGIDLINNILDQTLAIKDQDHVPLILLSLPDTIPDRSEFLLKKAKTNPAESVVELVLQLAQSGAAVVGMPCVTMHAPRIFDEIIKGLKKRQIKIKLLNLIEEMLLFIEENYPTLSKLGVLSTLGTAKTNVFDYYFSNKGFQIIKCHESIQQDVHDAIYNPSYGLKVKSNPASKQAREILFNAAEKLINKGCEIIILGCTEMPLAFTQKKIGDTVLVDPNLVLARALLKYIAPEKLKPLSYK